MRRSDVLQLLSTRTLGSILVSLHIGSRIKTSDLATYHFVSESLYSHRHFERSARFWHEVETLAQRPSGRGISHVQTEITSERGRFLHSLQSLRSFRSVEMT